MSKPLVCTVLTSPDPLPARAAEWATDFYELRIDLIGENWGELPRFLNKPWIATCRRADEGGKWMQGEEGRRQQLLQACQQGASMVDIELSSPGIERLVGLFKNRAEMIISYHNFSFTPPLEELAQLAVRAFALGADIAKIATTAVELEDNLTVLKLNRRFENRKIISIAMGDTGACSRILGPLAGNAFTYATAVKGQESAAGQLTAGQIKDIYTLLKL